MSPTNQIKIVGFAKEIDVVWPEGIGNSSLVLSPALSLFIGVAPKQITEESYGYKKMQYLCLVRQWAFQFF